MLWSQQLKQIPSELQLSSKSDKSDKSTQLDLFVFSDQSLQLSNLNCDQNSSFLSHDKNTCDAKL